MKPILAMVMILAGCSAPNPQPSPTPSPTPTPVATPTPDPCVVVPLVQSTSTASPDPIIKGAVRAAQEAVGDRCGYATADEEPQNESVRLVAKELRLRGYCAFADGDRVMIARDRMTDANDELREEHHVVYYRDGCWIATTFRGLLEVE